MPTIVDCPTLTKQALAVFGALCANAPARRHVAEYLTGLMVADRKTVSGIHRALAVTTDQSCWNRWRTATAWDVYAVNERRLAWLQQNPKTRDSPRGVMALDNPLGDHPGQLLEDVGWCWDPADERSVIAHNEVLSNSVGPAGAHSPMEWRRFRKRETCAAAAFQDHTTRGLALLDDAMARALPGDVPCDRSCTSAQVLNHLQRQQRASVGDRKVPRQGVYAGREPHRSAVAPQMPGDANPPIRSGTRRDWSCSTRMRIPAVGHPVRVGLFWQKRSAREASKALVRHRLVWAVRRMLLVYRHRWTGPETLQRDGKQPWGLGDCQGRSGAGQTRPVSLVSAAYSLLRSALHQSRPQEWARHTLRTIGDACRAVQAETLAQRVDGMADKLRMDHWSVSESKAVLVYP